MTAPKVTADVHTAAATSTWQAGYATGIEEERARIVAALRACASEGATILVEPDEMREIAEMIEGDEL